MADGYADREIFAFGEIFPVNRIFGIRSGIYIKKDGVKYR